MIRDTLVKAGRIDPHKMSVSTLRRLYPAHDLPRMARRAGPRRGPQRLRWQAPHPMALWHGDVCHAFKIEIDGVKRPVKIHALMDDASRFVVALEAHDTKKEADMSGLLGQALRRWGMPKTLYLDNGSTYSGEALATACARLGLGLIHAKPYDPQARGKMERFWRTLRGRCLDFPDGVSSLHDVNVRLSAFASLNRLDALKSLLARPSHQQCSSDSLLASPSDSLLVNTRRALGPRLRECRVAYLTLQRRRDRTQR